MGGSLRGLQWKYLRRQACRKDTMGSAAAGIGQVADKDKLQATEMKAVYKKGKRVRRPR
jgi:hypothetical protein